jgi:hypothetical protein
MNPAVEIVKADAMTGETSVAGVYVAEDACSPLQSVVLAASSGFDAAAFSTTHCRMRMPRRRCRLPGTEPPQAVASGVMRYARAIRRLNARPYEP